MLALYFGRHAALLCQGPTRNDGALPERSKALKSEAPNSNSTLKVSCVTLDMSPQYPKWNGIITWNEWIALCTRGFPQLLRLIQLPEARLVFGKSDF